MQLQELAGPNGPTTNTIRTSTTSMPRPRHQHPGRHVLSGKAAQALCRTDNPLPYALADYNAGRGNVLKWNHDAAATNSAAFLGQIGFPGTRHYVKSVMQRYDHYRGTFGA